jgi:hypothetical protein
VHPCVPRFGITFSVCIWFQFVRYKRKWPKFEIHSLRETCSTQIHFVDSTKSGSFTTMTLQTCTAPRHRWIVCKKVGIHTACMNAKKCICIYYEDFFLYSKVSHDRPTLLTCIHMYTIAKKENKTANWSLHCIHMYIFTHTFQYSKVTGSIQHEVIHIVWFV